jgi:hypothetical protein
MGIAFYTVEDWQLSQQPSLDLREQGAQFLLWYTWEAPACTNFHWSLHTGGMRVTGITGLIDVQG